MASPPEGPNKKRKKKNLVPELPASITTEKSVLGAVLKNNQLFFGSFIDLEKRDFYLKTHQIIFEAILEIFQENNQCDLVTLADYLKDRGLIDEAGGFSYVSELTDGVPVLESIDHYVRILKEKSLKRKLFYLANDLMTSVTEEIVTPEEILDKAQIKLLELAEGGVSKGFVNIGQIHKDFLEELEKKRKGYKPGLATGFIDIDNRTGGFQKQNLIIVAGRPGMGKTAFALNVAYNVAKSGGCVGIFSLEMSKEELYKRLVSIDSGIFSNKIRDGILTKEERQKIFDSANAISNMKIFIDETGGISIVELSARAKRLHDVNKCDLFIVDYIQLAKAGRFAESRVSEVSLISRGLKELAKELNVPLIAISQLSRAVETRPGARRPRLSDLRESGAIEQDADLVMFVYRPEVYYPNEARFAGIAEIIIAKHRNGTIGSELLIFMGATTKFTNASLPDKEEILNLLRDLE